jgi:hypothetical protein
VPNFLRAAVDGAHALWQPRMEPAPANPTAGHWDRYKRLHIHFLWPVRADLLSLVVGRVTYDFVSVTYRWQLDFTEIGVVN